MGRSDVDWKRQSRHAFNWVAVGIALALAAAYAALWLTTGRNLYVGTTAVLVAWTGTYLSPLWQPIGYVVGAVAVTVAALVMVVYDQWERPAAWVSYLLTAPFLTLVVYLFVTEDDPMPDEQST